MTDPGTELDSMDTQRVDLQPSNAEDSSGAELRRGQQIGRYVLIEEIGKGGMGTVFVALDPQLQRKVALKLLRSDRPGTDKAAVSRARLFREAKALAQLSHPNVITVYDVGLADERVFIAMELVAGRTIRRHLKTSRPGWEEILDLYVRAGQGLAAAHDKGLIHRDFKPDNVLVGPGGRVVVLDFGLAVDHRMDTTPLSEAEIELAKVDADEDDALTETGRAMGTPAYMAVEQHLGRPLDARTDQYSFCLSLWEGVYGRRPFTGRQVAGLVRQKSSPRLAQPPQTDVPTWLHDVLVRGMRPEPDDRFPTMVDLLEAIEEHRRPVRRRARVRWWLAGGLVTAMLVGAAWPAWRPTVCADGDRKLIGVWDDSRRAAVRAGFEGTGLGYAEQTWERVEHEVDRYTEQWLEARHVACEATHVERTQTDADLDARMACLDERLQELDARLALFERADPEILQRATVSLSELPSLERCADPRRLTAFRDAPADPELAAEVVRLRSRLTTIDALGVVGQYAAAAAEARSVVEEAHRLGLSTIEPAARFRLGRAQADIGPYDQAEQNLADAAWAASAVGDDEIAAEAMIELVGLVGDLLARPHEGLQWAKHAAAAIDRDGDDGLLRSHLLRATSRVHLREANYTLAEAGDREALALRRRLLGEEHHLVAESLLDVANDTRFMGELARAEVLYRESVAMHVRISGPEHPRTGSALLSLGAALAMQGKFGEAKQVLERALVLMENAFGRRSQHVANVLNNLGNIDHQMGEHERAIASLEEALSIKQELLGSEHPDLASQLWNLGGVYLKIERAAEAQRVFERALHLLELSPGPDHPRVGLALTNIGVALHVQGEYERARELHARALRIVEASLGPEHPDTAFPHEGLGRAYLRLGRPREAIAALEAALRIRERAQVDRRSVARVNETLAEAQWDAGERDQARATAQRALDDYRRSDAAPDVEKVEQWLRAHP